MNYALLFQILMVVLPKLKDYFTKNYGVNSVTSAPVGWWFGLLSVAFNDQATVDQAITFLMQNGKWGLVAAGILAGLRVAIFTIKGGWSGVVQQAKTKA